VGTNTTIVTLTRPEPAPLSEVGRVTAPGPWTHAEAGKLNDPAMRPAIRRSSGPIPSSESAVPILKWEALRRLPLASNGLVSVASGAWLSRLDRGDVVAARTNTAVPALVAARPETRPTAHLTGSPLAQQLKPPRVQPRLSTGTATRSRLAVLRPLARSPGLWIYVIRAGDVFERIAHWFGVSVTAMRWLNPRIRPSAIHPGRVLIVPTPSR
jgi:hypothetical protein